MGAAPVLNWRLIAVGGSTGQMFCFATNQGVKKLVILL